MNDTVALNLISFDGPALALLDTCLPIETSSQGSVEAAAKRDRAESDSDSSDESPQSRKEPDGRQDEGTQGAQPQKKKRKQFSACDQCREKRVKCTLQEVGSDKGFCKRCENKGLECTKIKIHSKKTRRPRKLAADKALASTPHPSTSNSSTGNTPSGGHSPLSSLSESCSTSHIISQRELGRSLGKDLVKSFAEKIMLRGVMLANETITELNDCVEVSLYTEGLADSFRDKGGSLGAAIVACGARFSSNPFIVPPGTPRHLAGIERERICQALLDRALKVMDVEGIMRKVGPEIVQTMKLILPLLRWRERVAMDPEVKKAATSEHNIIAGVIKLQMGIEFEMKGWKSDHKNADDEQMWWETLSVALKNRTDDGKVIAHPAWNTRILSHFPYLPAAEIDLPYLNTDTMRTLVGIHIIRTIQGVQDKFNSVLEGKEPEEYMNVLKDSADKAWNSLRNICEWCNQYSPYFAPTEDTMGFIKTPDGKPAHASMWTIFLSFFPAMTCIRIDRVISTYHALAPDTFGTLAKTSFEITLAACRWCAVSIQKILSTNVLMAGHEFIIADIHQIAKWLAVAPVQPAIGWTKASKEFEVNAMIEGIKQLAFAWNFSSHISQVEEAFSQTKPLDDMNEPDFDAFMTATGNSLANFTWPNFADSSMLVEGVDVPSLNEAVVSILSDPLLSDAALEAEVHDRVEHTEFGSIFGAVVADFDDF